jgi:uncharacterized membrane protein
VLLPALAWLEVTIVDYQEVPRIYRLYGEEIVAGAVPYRDVEIEYPPAAVPLFVLPALVTSSPLTYAIVFAGLVGALGMAGLALAARIGTMLAPPSRSWLVRTLGAGAIIGLLGSVALTRFDFAPAALTIAGLYLLLRDRIGWAGLLIGAAVAVKLYPAVIVPLALTYVFRRAGRRPAALFIGIACAVVVASYIPFLIAEPAGVLLSLRGQLERALQIESSGASIYWLAVEFGLLEWPDRGYYDLNSPSAQVVQGAMVIAGLLVLVLLWLRYARGPADGTRLVRYAFASVAAFVVFGKVLSPQYLLWLVLFVPALRGVRANSVTALLAAAALVTALYFPRWFPAIVEDLAPHGLAAIAIRNLLLVALLVALLWRIERGAKLETSCTLVTPRTEAPVNVKGFARCSRPRELTGTL